MQLHGFYLATRYILFKLTWEKFFGFIVTATAIALGSTFWFDLLSEIGLSGIASVNFNSLSAGVGFSFLVGQNLALGTGVMFTQKDILKEEYKDDGTEVVKENLSFEQLHDKLWMPELYFTIGFRFDKNPFAGKDKEDDDDDE